MFTFKYPLLLIPLVLLCGCVWRDPVVGNYVSSVPDAPWDGPMVSAIPNPEICIPTDHPLTVAEMVDIALSHNPATANSWATARAAAFNWQASQASLYPSVDFSETFAHVDERKIVGLVNNVDIPFSKKKSFNHFNSFQSQWSLQYLLMDFGARDAAIDATLQALYNANWTHNRALQNVTINVLDSYYGYVNAKELLRARLDDLRDSQANLDVADSQLQAGVVTRVDYLLAKSNFVNLQLSVEQLKGQVEVTLGQLASALGLPANAFLNVEMLPETLPLDQVSESIEELLECAKVQRPDLAATYANYRQQVANLEVARSEALPTLSLQGAYAHNTFPSDTKFNSYLNTTSIVLSVPIFTGFLHVNQIRGAQEQVVASYAEVQEKSLNVSLEVVTNYYAYKTAIQTLKYSEEYLKYAHESYNATFEGYRSGTQTFVDLLAAQAVLSNARASHVTARTQWVTSLANLSYATGAL